MLSQMIKGEGDNKTDVYLLKVTEVVIDRLRT